MKLLYRVMLVLFSLFVFIQQVQAQDTLTVEWFDGENVIKNALRDAIIADTTDRPDGRVYKLLRSGLYWLTDPVENAADRPLVIVGETKAPQGEDDFGPPVIQRVLRDDQSNPGDQMFSCFGDLTLKNVWLLGRTSSGARGTYEQFKILGDGKNYIFDNVIFDDCAWHLLGPDGPNNDFFVTNSKFRNLHGDTQIWEGLGVRFEVGADTVIFENNTFLNIGFAPFQSEAAPINYFLVNHNTFVNIGRNFSAGSLWKEIYVANNIFVNCFFQGEDYSQYSDPDRVDPYTGFFGIGDLPSEYGTNFDRQIYFGYNSYWRDQDFEDYYATISPNPIRSQPLINDTTQGWFDAWTDDGNMLFENNWTGAEANPDLTVYPLNTEGLIDSMLGNIQTLLVDQDGSGVAPLYIWDPGWNGDPTVNNFPLPENFSYSNTNLVGTDGLPLGDLNWYPADKATYLANKDSYVNALREKVGAPQLDILTTVEAEEATPSGDATEVLADGLLYYQMDGGGWIQWTFNVETGAEYDLNIQTNLRGNGTRGQRIIINGVNQAGGGIHDCFGYGEYIWDIAFDEGEPCENPHNGIDPNEWVWTRIIQGEINEAGALTFNTGENIIRIEASWGYQNFGSIQLLEPGTDNVVVELSAADAEYSGVFPGVEGAPWAPSGFKSVALGAGGAISFDVELPYNATYMCRIFYAADGTANGQLEVGGEVADPNVVFADTADVFTAQFVATAGNKTFKLSSAAGGVSIDYVQLIAFVPTSLRGDDKIPQGFSLDQNFPNPFNPSTKIHFELGKISQVDLTIYNVLGQRVAKLVNNQRLPKGSYTYDFNAARLASGVYFYRLETEHFTSQKKMILIK